MALNQTRTWLIAYDITCPRRLGRIHRYLKDQATPLQYSLFLAEESTPGILRIRDHLASLIDPKSDDVRLYPLPDRLELHAIGKSRLPEGVLLLSGSTSANIGQLLGSDKNGLHLSGNPHCNPMKERRN